MRTDSLNIPEPIIINSGNIVSKEATISKFSYCNNYNNNNNNNKSVHNNNISLDLNLPHIPASDMRGDDNGILPCQYEVDLA